MIFNSKISNRQKFLKKHTMKYLLPAANNSKKKVCQLPSENMVSLIGANVEERRAKAEFNLKGSIQKVILLTRLNWV